MVRTGEVHLERILGRRVVAANGRPVGRLEEVRAEKRGAGLVVVEYHLGPGALLERLSASVLRMFGGRRRRIYAVPWAELDLSDPEKPRLRGAVEDLRPPGASRE